MITLVEQKTSETAPRNPDGELVPETREDLSRRRLRVYRQVINAAWDSATPEMKEAVEARLEEEREAVANKKREEEESQDGEDIAMRTPESYAE